MTDVGVVVLLFNRWPEARAVLDAVLRQTLQPSSVVVVDNASTLDPSADIRADYPEVTVLRAHCNRGYAGGMNLAVEAMAAHRPDAYLFLTHDCLLADTALHELSEGLASDTRLGVVGPLLGYASRPTQVFSAGGQINRKSWRIRHDRVPDTMEGWCGRGVHRVAWLDGSCMLVRRRAFEQVGGFDERYFLYFEDVDLCLRARREGFEVACAVAARAWQEPSENLTRGLRTRNQLLMMRKNGAPAGALALELARGAWHALPPDSARRKMSFIEWVRWAGAGMWMSATPRHGTGHSGRG